MKTLAELKEMHFIPHHDCAVCGEMVGWYANEPNPWFDPSCACGGDGGHYDLWEDVFKWYNKVFEKESEQAVSDAWARGTMSENVKLFTPCPKCGQDPAPMNYGRCGKCGAWQAIALVEATPVRLGRDCIVCGEGFELMGYGDSRTICPDCCDAIKSIKDNRKSNWIPDSKGGEKNHD